MPRSNMRKISKKINIALIFMLSTSCLCSNVVYSQDVSALRVPLISDNNRKPEVIFAATHDKVLDYITGKEYIVICDADDDRTANAYEASKQGLPYISNEANWVVEAEKRGCDWDLLHPRWQIKEWPKILIPGPTPFITVDNFKPRESSRHRPCLVTICFDYFASLDRTVIDFDGHISRAGKHYPSLSEIEKEVENLAQCLRDKGIVPDKIICAESRNYCPEEYIPIIRSVISKAFSLASNGAVGNWFAGTWWQHVEFEYLYYHPRYFQVYYERLMQEISGDTKVFEGKHTVVLHAVKNLPPELITPIKDILLEYTDRVYGDSMVYKVLNVCNLTTVSGEPFMLVTLGYKRHRRLGWWKELQSEELKVVREILLLVDPEKNVVISGLNLGFEYEDSPLIVPYVRMSGLGRASCPVNSSLTVHEDYRNRLFGPTMIALGIKRACEILGKNNRGVIGEDIDSGSRSSSLERMFDDMGFSLKHPFGHGGKGVRLDELNTTSIFRVLPRSYEGPAIDMTKFAERTAL
jgi:hypothetical protein